LSLASILIPSSVETICGYCFDDCRNLSSVTFESGSRVSNIGECAFRNCISLRSISIPRSIQTICWFCFMNCEDLSEVDAGSEWDILRPVNLRFPIISPGRHLLFHGIRPDELRLFGSLSLI
jgi:hypothetical protein